MCWFNCFLTKTFWAIFLFCTGEKKEDIQFTNDILAMLSPEGEKVSLTRVRLQFHNAPQNRWTAVVDGGIEPGDLRYSELKFQLFRKSFSLLLFRRSLFLPVA